MTLHITDLIFSHVRPESLAYMTHEAIEHDDEYFHYLHETAQDWFSINGVDASTPDNVKDLLRGEVEEDVSLLVALNRPLLEFHDWFQSRSRERFNLSMYREECGEDDPHGWALDVTLHLQKRIEEVGIAGAAEAPYGLAFSQSRAIA